jgi:cysteinyl-tRNA synthetase
MEKGYAYKSNGSVYFDVEKYDKEYNYGILSGRTLEEQLNTTRKLEGQSEKRNSYDFALWKKASPTHIMRWKSKYSDGFPGWHLECTAMSSKYLGNYFDIHGGGMDLLFPHHECEIAQSTVVHGNRSAKYWMHNNMITINGQKMGKSLGNFITLEEFFTGKHKLLEKSFSPMVIKFFMLQAHYRSALDFSNEALMSAEKGLQRLLEGLSNIDKLKFGASSDFDIERFKNNCYEALNDDLNSPILIAHLFDAIKAINLSFSGKLSMTESDIKELSRLMYLFIEDILGLVSEQQTSDTKIIDKLVSLILEIRQEAKNKKDWATSDKIRDQLNQTGIEIKDGKEGSAWGLK